MNHSPTRWLATLAVLSGLLMALPSRAEAQSAQQKPNQLARQVPRQEVLTADMPNLVGLSLREAQRQPVVVKFRLTLVPESIDSTQYPPGTITRQSVAPGRSVRAETRIVVLVARGGVTVPRVEGERIEIARASLRKLGFGVEESVVPSTRVRPGIVSRQAPEAGTVRPRGSTVRLEVASEVRTDPRDPGRRGDDVSPDRRDLTEVPDLVEADEKTALARLQEARLEARIHRARSRGRPGVVIEQTPRRGTRVAPWSTVDITVSVPIPVGPEKLPDFDLPPERPPDEVTVTVPDLIGMQADRAGEVLGKAGLRGRARSARSSRTKPGAIIEQDPAPGAKVRRGWQVEFVVAEPERPPPPQPPPPPPPTQYMPNLVGRTFKDATVDAAVRQLRLRITPRDDPAASGRPGVIVRQSVAASAPIAIGAAVTVWVAAGVAVPPLVGLTADAARQRLDASGLQARVSEVVRDRDAGTVVEQTPAAGVVVPRGAAVGFSVAVLEMVRVPDVGGRDRRDAMNLLAASRLTGSVSNDDGSTLRPGLVSGQDPRPGSAVPVGSAVRVRVASGVVVPSVIGTAPTEARARLTAAGLSVESREVRTNRSGANTVIEQAPTAGQRVARGTAVLVSIAFPPLVTVPDVRGRQRGEAAGLLAAAHLKNDVSNDLTAALAPGLVTSQAPRPGAQVEAGSVVRLQVAVGVVVPSVVGAGVEDARARVVSSGLRANVREVRTDAARPGTVFEQLPVADERVARGSVVELSLARLPLVTVPDLAQRTRAEAESLIKATRLLAAFDDDRESTLPPDRVSRQEPAPGTPVEAGQTVRVAMSTGVLVPSVLKMTAQSARGTLAAAGLRSEERGEVSDLFPESTVMDQAPESNARVARGSAIRLLIAVRRTVTVPDLRGRARSEIAAILAPIPLVASFDVATQSEPGAVADTVVRQSPAAGSVVGAGTAVTVFLAQAAQAPAPPAPPATSQPQPASPAQPPQSLQPEPTPLPRPATGWRARVIPWVVGLGFFGLLGYRFYAANHTRPHAVAHEAPPPPPPQVNLDPHQDEMTSRLEVSGQGLIQFEVRIQSGLDAGEQFLSVDGPLAGEDRRVYE